MIVVIMVSVFFLLFLGVMMLGNHLSHQFEKTLNKQADQELADRIVHLNEQQDEMK